MQLTHKIALCPTPEQAEYFKRACGTARRVWTWARRNGTGSMRQG